MPARIPILYALLLLIIAAHLGSMIGQAQEVETKQDVNGVVKDESGRVLPGVLVTVQGSGLSTSSDNTGYFLLKGVPIGNVVFTASLPRFTTKEIPLTLQAGQPARLEIVLELDLTEYSELFDQSLPKMINASDGIGVLSVQPRRVSTLPYLGERDVIQSTQLMPGFIGTNETASGPFVRGGTPGQNLVLFDGFTVYGKDHLFGTLSPFNAPAMEGLIIHRGGFEARHGGRISNFVELAGKDIRRREEISLGGSISALSLGGYVDGPLGKKGTFSFAARRSYGSPVSSRIRDNYSDRNSASGGRRFDSYPLKPSTFFSDLNGRLTFAPSPSDTIVMSVYYGYDRYDISRSAVRPGFGEGESESFQSSMQDWARWGHTGSSITWQRNWSPNYLSSLTMAYSRYFKNYARISNITSTNTLSGTQTTTVEGSSESNRLDDVTFRWGNSVLMGRRHTLEFGSELTRNRVEYDFDFNDGAGIFNRKQQALQFGIYLQDRWRPSGMLEITPGVRFSGSDLTGKNYFEPRLSLVLQATNRVRLKGAAGRYYQYTQDMIREDPLQGDPAFWTLSDDTVVPVSWADQFVGGISYETDNYLFGVEGYRMNLNQLTEFAPQRSGRQQVPGQRLQAIDFNRLFFTGSGRAEGVELLAQRKVGGHTGWIAYTLGRVTRDFPDLSPGSFRATHDSTHEFKVVDTFRFKMFTISGSWVYATGKPYTALSGAEKITLENGRTFLVPIFGDKNALQLPDYHRLDASVTWDAYQGESNRVQLGASVFNAANRYNVWRREYDLVADQALSTDINYLGLTISGFINVDLNIPSEIRKAGPAWRKEEPKGLLSKAWEKPAKVFDFYGRVVSMGGDRITLETQMGTGEFQLAKSTIKGEDEYEKGALVHLYYRKQTEGNVVTMIVRKVDKSYKWTTYE